tara:strand:+ start:3777 stop:4487 length:711 start_codon:yes stop_codon:yes gene_type:complete
MLTWTDVDFFYKKQKIFSKINLELSRDKNYLLVGPNGMGKSTFIKLAMGYIQPQAGKIIRNFSKFNYVPPNNHLHPCLKVSDLIDLYIDQKQKFYSSKTYKTLDIEDLDEQSYLSNLSSGQRQRLLLALSLVRPSEMDFFDEPTNHLDYYYKNQFYMDLNLRKSCKLLVCHDLQSALQIKNSHILLVDKKGVLDLGPSDEALLSPQLQNAFRIKVSINNNPVNGRKMLAISNYETR